MTAFFFICTSTPLPLLPFFAPVVSLGGTSGIGTEYVFWHPPASTSPPLRALLAAAALKNATAPQLPSPPQLRRTLEKGKLPDGVPNVGVSICAEARFEIKPPSSPYERNKKRREARTLGDKEKGTLLNGESRSDAAQWSSFRQFAIVAFRSGWIPGVTSSQGDPAALGSSSSGKVKLGGSLRKRFRRHSCGGPPGPLLGLC